MVPTGARAFNRFPVAGGLHLPSCSMGFLILTARFESVFHLRTYRFPAGGSNELMGTRFFSA
jgi:hypothetical protein